MYRMLAIRFYNSYHNIDLTYELSTEKVAQTLDSFVYDYDYNTEQGMQIHSTDIAQEITVQVLM